MSQALQTALPTTCFLKGSKTQLLSKVPHCSKNNSSDSEDDPFHHATPASPPEPSTSPQRDSSSPLGIARSARPVRACRDARPGTQWCHRSRMRICEYRLPNCNLLCRTRGRLSPTSKKFQVSRPCKALSTVPEAGSAIAQVRAPSPLTSVQQHEGT